MKFTFYLVILIYLSAACKSSQSSSRTQESKPRYNIVYEGNKRLQLREDKVKEEPEVEFKETEKANDFNETPSVIKQKIEPEFIDEIITTKSISTDAKPAIVVEQISAPEPKLKPEHLGELGLAFSVVAVLLFFLAAGTGIIGIAGFAFLLLIFGFIFSIAGLKTKFKRQAMIGLIISGTIILLGLIALIFYLVRG